MSLEQSKDLVTGDIGGRSCLFDGLMRSIFALKTSTADLRSVVATMDGVTGGEHHVGARFGSVER